MVDLNKIVAQAIQKNASDIHLMTESKPVYRIGNALVKMEGSTILKDEDLNKLYSYFLKNKFVKNIDLIHEIDGVKLRVNISLANKIPVFAIKILKNKFPEYDELRIPEIVRKTASEGQGLMLVSGIKKSGKTTTLNALVRHLNETQNKKIITLESSIEYLHKQRSSIIIQKEVGSGKDFANYYDGIINALKEDCDILVVEKIRDRETMDAVLEVVETGRLVIAGLDAESCEQAIEKITNFYEIKEQTHVKYSLSKLLKLVTYQKLIVSAEGKLELISEVKVTDNKKANITIIDSLADLYVANKITLKQAKMLLETEEQKEELNNNIMKKKI